MRKEVAKVKAYYDEKARDGEYRDIWYDHSKKGTLEVAAQYPADQIRVDIVKKRLIETRAKTVLDAGCGCCVPMLQFLDVAKMVNGYVEGFDLSPVMVAEGKKLLEENGYDSDLAYEANLDDDLTLPRGKFDAIVVLGAFPHLPSQKKSLESIYKRLNEGGRVYVEFRNELFAAFSFNRYTYEYMKKLIDFDKLPNPVLNEVDGFYDKIVVTPESRIREKGIDYEELLAQFNNPLTIGEMFKECGFTDIRLHFYHFHALPPVFEKKYPELFHMLSLEMEKPDDWRGYLMASAFVVEAKR